MKHTHLLPILSILPLVAVLLILSQTDIYIDSFIYAAVAVGYVAVNVIYRHLHKTLKVGYVVEYSLIALIAYFILTTFS